MFKPLKNSINLIPLLAVPFAGVSMEAFASDYPIVQMKKLNSDTFSVDGKRKDGHKKRDIDYCLNGKKETKHRDHKKSNNKVYLERCSDNNDNQQWYEIARGDSYFSYQKVGTDHCLDGNKSSKHSRDQKGGKNKQNVYLGKCSDTNDNQHWLKVDMGDGQYRVENRNAEDSSLDSKSHWGNKKDIYLSTSNDDNPNQHWSFNYIRSGGATFVGAGGTVAGALPVSCETPEGFTVVNSLSAMIQAMKTSDVNVALAAGTYTVDESNTDLFTAQSLPNSKNGNTLFAVDGSNSQYDFRCANIKYDTDLWAQFGSTQVYQLRTVGNYNTISNLIIEDIGDTSPTGGAVGVVMDGRDNIIEGLTLTSRGSKPYGLGDAYGKGGGPVLSHKKHSAVLIRGLRNTFKQSTVFNNAYGHSVFMQGSETTLIDGVYIQGNLRSTADMLAANDPRYAAADERAANIDFNTIWGYKLPTGYVMSLQEAGIRAYNAGRTVIDGVEYGSRAARDVTVLNSVIRHTRTGVTLAHAKGERYVENTTVLGCEQGYSIGYGTIANSYADADYGPVLTFAYSSDNHTNADITVLPTDGSQNGWGAVAYIAGKNHNITLRSAEGTVNQNLKVVLSGDKHSIRHLEDSLQGQDQLTLLTSEVNNLTPFPMVINELAEGSTGQSNGPISGYVDQNSIQQN